MIKIIQAPEAVLAQKATPVQKVNKQIKKLLSDMAEALDNAHDPEGVGLAAPQVGKSLQIFVVRQQPNSPQLTFINPVIEEFIDEPKTPKKKSKKETSVQLEGCLSLHNIWGIVNRKFGVILSYQDENGKAHKQKFDGFLATIIQHEVDHLHGILFPNRVLEQNNKLYHSVKNEAGEIEFEEIEL